MPYYRWRGVDILGAYKSGKMYARSADSLDALLFKREIALLSCKPTSWRWRYRAISAELHIEFFKQLATLLDGGVSLPESLLITAEQLHHPGMQEIIHELASTVDHGNSLSNALLKYPAVFDPITIQLTKAGEESGSLAQAMESIAERLEMRHEFSRAVRAALILPALTFGFFLLITYFLFTFVVPKFADLFASMQSQLPASTLFMLRVSNFLSGWGSVILIGVTVLTSYLIYNFMRSTRGRKISDQVVLHVPILSTVIWYRFIAYFLASISLLLERGMQLVPALHTIAQTMENNVLKVYVLELEQAVINGRSLSAAMQDVSPHKFPLELVALVHVGENSGALELLLKKASVRYQQQVKSMLTRLTSFIQPLLMIVLGLLVLLLIFAIYMPIIQLSYVV